MRGYNLLRFSEGGRGNRMFPRVGKQAFAEGENARLQPGQGRELPIGGKPSRPDSILSVFSRKGRRPYQRFLRSGVSSAKRSPVATIGIPRALFYWKQPFFWETFFKELGFEVLLSPETNKEIIEKGVKAADTETCFSIKVLYGHLLFLEGKVDLIFLPRLKKNELGEYCPKFFGLPDLGTILLKTPLLSPRIDLSKEDLTKTLIKIGKKLGKRKIFIREAMDRTFSKICEKEKKAKEEYERKLGSSKKKIILISHPYNLHDEYVNLGMKEKLEKLGVEVVFIDEVPLEEREKQSDYFPRFHWEFGKEMLAQTRKITKEKIAGAIEISAFQCGSDAVVKEFIEKEVKEKKIPFLYLLIDEHTAEAGLQTRLEAFIDTLKL